MLLQKVHNRLRAARIKKEERKEKPWNKRTHLFKSSALYLNFSLTGTPCKYTTYSLCMNTHDGLSHSPQTAEGEESRTCINFGFCNVTSLKQVSIGTGKIMIVWIPQF